MAELLYIDSSGSDLYGQSMFGQSIVPDADWTVNSVWIDLMYVTVAGNAVTYVYADSAGDPSGAALFTSDANAVAESPGGAETFTFSTPALLSNGVKYWFIFHSAGTNIYGWRTSTDPYAAGVIGYTTHATDPTVSWNAEATIDMRQFKVNGTVGFPAGGGIISVAKRGNLLRRRR